MKRRDPQMCTYWSSRAFVCKFLRPMTARELQTCRFDAPRRFNFCQNWSQNSTKRDGEKNENCGLRGKKKLRNFGPPPFGGPTLWGPHPSEPHPFGAPLCAAPPFWVATIEVKTRCAKTSEHQNWPKSAATLAKIGLAKVGTRLKWPKSVWPSFSQNSKALRVAFFGQFEHVKTGLTNDGHLKLAKVGQILLAKIGLAKVGFGQSR